MHLLEGFVRDLDFTICMHGRGMGSTGRPLSQVDQESVDDTLPWDSSIYLQCEALGSIHQRQSRTYVQYLRLTWAGSLFSYASARQAIVLQSVPGSISSVDGLRLKWDSPLYPRPHALSGLRCCPSRSLACPRVAAGAGYLGPPDPDVLV